MVSDEPLEPNVNVSSVQVGSRRLVTAAAALAGAALLGTALVAPASAVEATPPQVAVTGSAVTRAQATAAGLTYVRTGSVALPTGAVPLGLDPGVHHGFVVAGTDDDTAVVGIDLRTGKQFSRVVLPDLRLGVGDVDLRTHQLLVSSDRCAYLVDTRSGRPLHPDSPIRLDGTVTSATWDPVGGRFWLTVVNFEEHRPNSEVVGLDPATGSMVYTSEGERPQTAYVYDGSAPDTARDRVLVTDSEDYGLKVLSISTGRQVGQRIIGEYGLGPVDTRTGSVYATVKSDTYPFDHRLVRLSTTTGAITAEIGGGVYRGAALDQSRSLLYAIRPARSGTPETVDVLDESTFAVLATLTGSGGLFIDTVSHDVYVVSSGYTDGHPAVIRYSPRQRSTK